MASKQTSWAFILVLVIMTVLAVDVSSTSIGHTPSRKVEDFEFSEAKEKTERAKDKAWETGKETKEATESWTEWAKEKISEGLGLKHDDVLKDVAKKTYGSAATTAKSASDSTTQTAKKASDSGADTTSKTKDVIKDATCRASDAAV
ncbi:hypothetical protein SLE2022_222920 [Rubroshorea leprosula]